MQCIKTCTVTQTRLQAVFGLYLNELPLLAALLHLLSFRDRGLCSAIECCENIKRTHDQILGIEFQTRAGPDVLSCQTLLLCSHFTPADTQRHILSGQVSAQLHVDML